MAGTGQNPQQQQQKQDPHQKNKYDYFNSPTTHSPVLLIKTPSSPSVCPTTRSRDMITDSGASPWYHSSHPHGDNDDTKLSDESPSCAMIRQSPSIPLNTDGPTTAQQPDENNGHFFAKKTFHKPAYCHHCLELLWGLIGQGYYCEGRSLASNERTRHAFCLSSPVCNFICHDRCRKQVISPCSSIAPILIKVS